MIRYIVYVLLHISWLSDKSEVIYLSICLVFVCDLNYKFLSIEHIYSCRRMIVYAEHIQIFTLWCLLGICSSAHIIVSTKIIQLWTDYSVYQVFAVPVEHAILCFWKLICTIYLHLWYKIYSWQPHKNTHTSESCLLIWIICILGQHCI